MQPAALVAAVLCASLGACATPGNPPAPGFDEARSDAAAVALADRVMERMGGRAAWDQTRYLVWNFFGSRSHVWDRALGLDRVQGTLRETSEPYVAIVQVAGPHAGDAGAGHAWVGGEPIDDERQHEILEGAYRAWINDSYWLVMPYKLKDTGVTLRSLGARDMLDGKPADVLELTFSSIGVTPSNKYHVYVARESGLVEQWDFFQAADDVEPRFQAPWRDWQEHGRILLSGDRGERKLTEIGAYDEIQADVFWSPRAVELSALGE